MKLTKLQAQGFKSFAKPIEFHFNDGITGLIGPNGCGKSNVVDAFKWVLGDRSAKSLRGSEMRDVIFNGSNSNSSASYAEVSLSFSNNGNGHSKPAEEQINETPPTTEGQVATSPRKSLPIEYDEVTITRRLYRSGESEYLINSQPVRLKDIKELFMGTGIGMESYSIIEQGKIDFILQSNSRERRGLFEEAAGVSKYKAKKRETESKLERVNQDLLRLSDIIREVKREIRSIKIQATKAEKYRRMLAELKEKKTRLAMHHYRELKTDQNRLTDRIGEINTRQQALIEQIKSLEESVIQIEQELLVLDNNFKRHQSNLLTINSQHASVSQEITNARQRRTEYNETLDQAKQSLGQTTEKAVATRNKLCGIMQEIETLKNDITSLAATLESKNNILQELNQGIETLTQELETKRNNVLNSAHKKSRYQNELTSIQAELKNLSIRREKTEKRTAEIDSELANGQDKIYRLKEEQETIFGKNNALKEELHQREASIESRKEEAANLLEAITRQREEVHRKTSRQEVLEDLENHQEGLDRGVTSILEALKSNPQQFGTVHGIVADLIDLEPNYVSAVEAVLKDMSQAIVTQTMEDSLRVLEFIKKGSYGRVTTIALDNLHNHINRCPPLPHVTGVRGQADQLVKTEPHLKPLVEFLLGDYLVVENLDIARQIMINHSHFRPMLTLTSEVISAAGVISVSTSESAGTAFSEPGINLLSRKSELRRIPEDCARLQEKLMALESQYAQWTSEIDNLVKDCQSLRYQVYDQKTLEVEKQRQREEITQRQDLLTREKEINKLDLTEANTQIDALSERSGSIVQMLRELSGSQNQLNTTIEQLNQRISRHGDEKKTLGQEVTELKIKQAHSVARQEQLENMIIEVNNQIAHFETTLNDISRTITDLKNKISTLETTLQEKELVLKQLTVDQTQLQDKNKTLTEESERLKTSCQDKKMSGANCQQEKQQLVNEHNELTLQEKESSLKLDNLQEKHTEDTGINLAEAYDKQVQGENVAEGFSLPSQAGSEQTNNGNLKDFDGELSRTVSATSQETEEANWEDLSHQVEELKSKMGSATDVNMYSIDQLKELEERFKFLSEQEADLNKSKESLQELIRKLNRTSREMFQITFDQIHNNFNILFRKLFGGGKAQLILENENGSDVLDAGIEIIAKPPGKEPSSISLLSGGEKTLTALALVMSIFQLNPSPFCILDEADATLDETNVDRFVALVKQFTGNSQFIIITHNKKTMLAADVLYGLTMQTSGISKKISVKMSDDAPITMG